MLYNMVQLKTAVALLIAAAAVAPALAQEYNSGNRLVAYVFFVSLCLSELI